MSLAPDLDVVVCAEVGVGSVGSGIGLKGVGLADSTSEDLEALEVVVADAVSPGRKIPPGLMESDALPVLWISVTEPRLAEDRETC